MFFFQNSKKLVTQTTCADMILASWRARDPVITKPTGLHSCSHIITVPCCGVMQTPLTRKELQASIGSKDSRLTHAGPFVRAQGPQKSAETIGWCCCTALTWIRIVVDVCEDHIKTGKNIYVALREPLMAYIKHKDGMCFSHKECRGNNKSSFHKGIDFFKGVKTVNVRVVYHFHLFKITAFAHRLSLD